MKRINKMNRALRIVKNAAKNYRINKIRYESFEYESDKQNMIRNMSLISWNGFKYRLEKDMIKQFGLD